MTKKEAWYIVREHLDHGYEGEEEEEMSEYIKSFEEAYSITRAALMSDE